MSCTTLPKPVLHLVELPQITQWSGMLTAKEYNLSCWLPKKGMEFNLKQGENIAKLHFSQGWTHENYKKKVGMKACKTWPKEPGHRPVNLCTTGLAQYCLLLSGIWILMIVNEPLHATFLSIGYYRTMVHKKNKKTNLHLLHTLVQQM